MSRPRSEPDRSVWGTAIPNYLLHDDETLALYFGANRISKDATWFLGKATDILERIPKVKRVALCISRTFPKPMTVLEGSLTDKSLQEVNQICSGEMIDAETRLCVLPYVTKHDKERRRYSLLLNSDAAHLEWAGLVAIQNSLIQMQGLDSTFYLLAERK